MCIVSIFSEGNGDFILTHNRDESRLRPFSKEIKTSNFKGQQWTGPVDLVSGGTWIYYSDKYVCCILNGAYKKHSHRPPYKMSRGLMILKILKYHSIDDFSENFNPKGIEEFTMIMLGLESAEKKILVWDGKEKFLEDHSHEKLIVRSSTPLYSETEKDFHFKSFNSLKNHTPEKIFELHNQLKMLSNNRFETVQTTSITQISYKENNCKLKFCPIQTD